MSLVLDSSIALSWFFEDERTDATMLLLRRVADDGAVVPTLWRYEVANGLAMAVRRNRIGAAYRQRTLSHLTALDVDTDRDSHRLAWSETMAVSERHRLTIYDASYLELAQRRRLPLATLDDALHRAAAATGVSLVGA